MTSRLGLLLMCGLVLVAACDGGPTDPDPIRPHFSVANTLTGDPQGVVDGVFKSTNEINYNKAPTKWAHVLWVESAVVVPGKVTLRFVSNRPFASCFEYRIDNEPNTVVGAHPNAGITDGRWTATCQNNSSTELTLTAQAFVDVRHGYGAESDERFNWTRFYVLSLDNKDQCKGGQWEAMGFKNQGQCVRFVETGRDSRIGQ